MSGFGESGPVGGGIRIVAVDTGDAFDGNDNTTLVAMWLQAADGSDELYGLTPTLARELARRLIETAAAVEDPL